MNESYCHHIYKNVSLENSITYCRTVFDGLLCWPFTEAGLQVNQSCPLRKEMNSSQVATRTCGIDGMWLSSNYSKNSSQGYTNFDNCLPPHAVELMNMCRQIDAEKCLQIIYRSRMIEMVGLTVSMISLILSIFIFHRYRILKNNRTKIHKNLFIATTMQVVIRLIIYIDQSLDPKFIGETEYLCEMCIILLEYAKTAMFMWMFIEGLYLHNVITVAVFQEHSYIKVYFYIGWGCPLVMTTVWALVMIFAVENTGCWFLYNLLSEYWMLEGPRYTVIIVNMLFLLNIIRALVVKLRQSRTSEIEQVRKAVRAAIFLLPLMGIANILFIADYKLFRKAWKFALWLYVSYFLTTFQGFFVAVLYCFLNEEVKSAIKSNITNYFVLRNRNQFLPRNSGILDNGLTNPDFDP